MLTAIIGAVVLGDGLLFVCKRRVIEPRVRNVFPKLNAGAVAAAEIICGTLLILLAII